MSSLFGLYGKRAVITGGSRGLGFQVAEAFVAAGASVLITARHEGELQQAATRLCQSGNEAKYFVGDLREDQSAERIAEAADGLLGGVDILVNNAGASWAEPAETHSLEGWNKVLDLNASAIFRLSQKIGRRFMIPAGSGKILNIASIGGLRGNRPDFEMHTIAYNASKGAVVNFTRALATEWGRYNINVNCLCPGFFPSQMSSKLLERIGGAYIQSTPLGRLGGDEDLKGPAVFLVSDAARHITGQCLVVDGGATAC